jgi:hypothetical protein
MMRISETPPGEMYQFPLRRLRVTMAQPSQAQTSGPPGAANQRGACVQGTPGTDDAASRISDGSQLIYKPQFRPARTLVLLLPRRPGLFLSLFSLKLTNSLG